MPVKLPPPQLQIDFALALEQIRSLYLQDALGETVRKLETSKIDEELSTSAPAAGLARLAGFGLRGELMFAVPCVLTANPRLLGYYRLLLGFSQKAFYTSEFGLASFKVMEEKGVLGARQTAVLKALCRALNVASGKLLNGIGERRINAGLLHDLSLLTVGPQLRGGYNVAVGLAAIERVFEAIIRIVDSAIVTSEARRIEIVNAARRKVVIQFAADPDIIIREEMAPNAYRNIIAIEVKGGLDFSNIHNRLGEAEKSHQKARFGGYHECWTVVNVDRINLSLAKQESPTTNRFYRLSQLISRRGDEYQDFENRVISLTGIPSGAPGRKGRR